MMLRHWKLELLIAVRSVGWVPPLLFAAWFLFSSMQEPPFFRLHDIHLLRDAVWAGAGLLAALYLSVGRIPSPVTPAFGSNLLLLAGIGLIAGLATFASDSMRIPWLAAEPWSLAATVLLHWAPLAALVPGILTLRLGTLPTFVAILVAAALLLGLGAPGEPLGARHLAGSFLATIGASMLSLFLECRSRS